MVRLVIERGPSIPTPPVSPANYTLLLRRRDPQVLARFRSYATVVAEFLLPRLRNTTRCLISPGLESNLPATVAQLLVAETRRIFPGCELVWNPLNPARQGTIPATILEYHGLRRNVPTEKLVTPCLTSLDGVDIQLPTRPPHHGPSIKSTEIPGYLADFAECDTIFMWVREFNGRHPERFTDPRERDGFPTEAVMEALGEMQ